MMSTNLDAMVLATTAGASVTVLFVLLLRRPLRAAFGARVAYGLWSLPPLAILAVLLPVPTHPVAGSVLAMVQVAPIQAFADAPAAQSASTAWLAIWLLGVVAMLVWIGWQQRRRSEEHTS